MKKFLVAALALVCSGSAFAIDYEPEDGLTTQVFLGMTATNLRGLDIDGKVGGTAGIKFEYMLPNAHGTYINAGLDWIMKGAKQNIGGYAAEVTLKSCPHYIELPVHVGYRYNIMQDLGVYADFGPYFSFGVAGNNKYSTDNDVVRPTLPSSQAFFKKSATGIQRWDAGLGFRVGCEYQNHYSLNLACDWGLTDMYTNDYREAELPNHKLKNFAFTLSFGYRF